MNAREEEERARQGEREWEGERERGERESVREREREREREGEREGGEGGGETVIGRRAATPQQKRHFDQFHNHFDHFHTFLTIFIPIYDHFYTPFRTVFAASCRSTRFLTPI